MDPDERVKQYYEPITPTRYRTLYFTWKADKLTEVFVDESDGACPNVDAIKAAVRAE